MKTASDNAVAVEALKLGLIADAFRCLDEVGNTSSMNEKASALSKSRENQVLAYLLKATYNPFVNYYIRKLPDLSPDGDPSVEHFIDLYALLKSLSARLITGNEAYDKTVAFLKTLSPDEYQWYSRVIGRDLRIGISSATINKVFKKLIPTYSVQLADKVFSNDLSDPRTWKQLPDTFYTQYKIDGYRCNLFVDWNGEAWMKTRSGKLLTGYNKMLQQATYLPRGYVYDGEIVDPKLYQFILDHKDSTSVTADRQLFAEAMRHCHSKEVDKQGVLNIFDAIPIDEWNSQRTTEDYSMRVSFLNQLIPEIANLSCFRIVPTYGPFHKASDADLHEVEDLFHSFLNTGWEGAMIKDRDTTYSFKRSKSVLKMKLMDTADLTVKSLFEGSGKYSGMMGGAIVDYKGNELHVGSGWSDEQRLAFWTNPNAIVGKTIEVAYQAETKNLAGGTSVSFPVFKQIRTDK